MTTKTIRIPFGALTSGARMTVPFRTFESAVEEIKRLYPDEAEQKTCMVEVTIHGCTIEHMLTAAEQVVDLRAQLEAALARIRELENKGERGSGIEGTPAAPIGHTWGPSDVTVAAPADRRQVFMNWFVRSGWRLPENLTPVWFGVLQQGVTHAEAEEWLALVPDTLGAHGRELGLTAPAGGGS